MKELKTESVLQYTAKQRQKWRHHAIRSIGFPAKRRLETTTNHMV